jgi:hypothetical protein
VPTTCRRIAADTTFPTKSDARAFLSGVETDLKRGNYIDPSAGRIAFAEYADWWVEQRPLRPNTVAKIYRLLRTIPATAVDDGLLPSNPARIRGASEPTQRRMARPTDRDCLAVTLGPKRAGARRRSGGLWRVIVECHLAVYRGRCHLAIGSLPASGAGPWSLEGRCCSAHTEKMTWFPGDGCRGGSYSFAHRLDGRVSRVRRTAFARFGWDPTRLVEGGPL